MNDFIGSLLIGVIIGFMIAIWMAAANPKLAESLFAVPYIPPGEITIRRVDPYEGMEEPSNSPELTAGEHEVLNLLAEAWRKFLLLPPQHPMHQQEFCTRLHDIQRIVMIRPVTRREGWIKDNEGRLQR